jgi:ABC-type transporter Mla subunit MlaD
MSFHERKGLWAGLAIMAAVVAVLVWLFVFSRPFLLVILFDDVGGLKRGDPVLWKGFAIGRVEKIEPLVDNKIGVTVRIRQDYEGRITSDSDFVLKRSAFMGLIGQDAIEILTPASQGRPYASGEKVQGTSPPAQTLVEQGKTLAQQFWRQLNEQAGRLMTEFQNSPYRQEAADAFKELETLAGQGMAAAKEGLEQFRRDHQDQIDRVLKKLSDLRDRMRKAGDEAGAREVEKQIEGLKSNPTK